MTSELIQRLKDLAAPIIEEHGAFLVDMHLRAEGSGKVVEVYADTDRGITIDECAHISRSLSVELDRANMLAGRYRLEVSSPDLHRPLKLFRQYTKNVGRRLKVITLEGNVPIVTVGTLVRVTETELELQQAVEKRTIVVFEKIKEAYVLPQFGE